MIAANRGLPQESVVAAAGSSPLIHLILRQYLAAGDTISLLEPTYSEYDFAAGQIGAKTSHHVLLAEDRFDWNADRWLEEIRSQKPRVAVLVSPNNPTGSRVSPEAVWDQIPPQTTLVIDEAYIDYTDQPSAERLAAEARNVVVIKSMSKANGLSGARLAYAVMHPDLARSLRQQLPPWSVSGPAQWLGCRVREHLGYYRARHAETGRMRQTLVQALSALPGRVLADCANWALWERSSSLSNRELLPLLAERSIFVRDASLTSCTLSDRTLRLAVRPPAEQTRMISALEELEGASAR